MAGRGINKVILVGNLGADPEARSTQSGVTVANLRVATTDRRKDRDSGEWIDHTEWHRVVLFGRTAEVAEQYLRKGSRIYLEGRLQTRKWQDQEGRDRYNTEVVGNDMMMLDRRGETSGEPPSQGGESYDGPSGGPSGGADGGGERRRGAPTRGGGRESAPRAPRESAPGPADSGGGEDFDDDIPF